MKRYLISTFWALVTVFFVIVSEFCVPVVKEFFRGSILFLLPFLVFFLLGIVLIFFTVKEKMTGKLKKFLILTGASATGFFISVLLHNFIYGVFIYFFGSDFWERIGTGDEPFFFFVALFVCPIGFLIGVIGSIVLFINRRNKF